MPWSCSVLTSRSNLEGSLEGQDGLAEEGEHQAVVDLQGDFQGDPHLAGAVRAAQKGSLQHRKVLVLDFLFVQYLSKQQTIKFCFFTDTCLKTWSIAFAKIFIEIGFLSISKTGLG